jgi:RNA polymerase sigma-70 factor (ECF subfamily)
MKTIVHHGGLGDHAGESAGPAWDRRLRSQIDLPNDDEAAFAGLVERQSRFAYRVAFAVLRNTHDAEDAVQEMFLKLFRNGGWRAMKEERAYLARAVWRSALDRMPRRREAEETFADLDPPSAERNPEQSAVSANWHATVHRLIDKLPEELRLPLALSATEELTSRQIAEILGVPEGTVRTRIARARQLLKEKLAVHMEGRYAK